MFWMGESTYAEERKENLERTISVFGWTFLEKISNLF